MRRRRNGTVECLVYQEHQEHICLAGPECNIFSLQRCATKLKLFVVFYCRENSHPYLT
jgi:hypothetical protein